TQAVPSGFDVVFDGVGEDSYRKAFAALRPAGLLCAYGYTAGVQRGRGSVRMFAWLGRIYLWRRILSVLPRGKRMRIYSINLLRWRYPRWFHDALEHLFQLLASGAIHPRVAERISFAEMAEAHRRLEAGGLEGRLVLCPDRATN